MQTPDSTSPENRLSARQLTRKASAKIAVAKTQADARGKLVLETAKNVVTDTVHIGGEVAGHAGETAAAIKLQAHIRGKQARDQAKIVKGEVRVEIVQIAQEIFEGQDGLGAIVGAASRRNKKVDIALHSLSTVGCECAHRHRVKIMVTIQLIGVFCFASAVCGAQGLNPHTMKILPWTMITETNISAHNYLWWAYGPAGIASNADPTSTAFKRFYDESSPMWKAHPDPIAYFAQVNMTGHDAAFLNTRGGDVPPPSLGTWSFNQWGICLFPEEAWVLETLQCCAIEPYTVTAEGGICRDWSVFDAVVMSGSGVGGAGGAGGVGASPFEMCMNPAIDGFSLIMGAFGAFTKIMEPIPRMKPATDGHQKTVVLLIIIISSIPSLLGVLTFSLGCYKSLWNYANDVGAEAKYGAGAAFFLLSLILLGPIIILHLIVPSPVSTARASRIPHKQETAVVENSSSQVSGPAVKVVQPAAGGREASAPIRLAPDAIEVEQ